MKHFNETHGMTNTRTYHSWQAMKRRCNNKKSDKYKWYGARGIRVCKEWNESFEAFIKDMGLCPEGMTLERIDNQKNYYKNNCKWATMKEQSNNTRTTIMIDFHGAILAASTVSEIIGVRHETLTARIRKGIPRKYLFLKRVPRFWKTKYREMKDEA